MTRPTLLALLTAVTLTSTAWADEPLIAFGSDSETSGKGALAGPNAAVPTFTENKDAVLITTPNWWSTLVQFEKFTPVPMNQISPSDFLTLKIRGSASGQNPKLKVVLSSPEWKGRAEWTFDLSGIEPDKFQTVRAETDFGHPEGGETAAAPSSLGVIQMATRGQDNLPWQFEIQSLGVSETK
jgi:hypothetical protein